MKKLKITEFNTIIQNLVINAPNATGNLFHISLSDRDIYPIKKHLLLWMVDETDPTILNIAGNSYKILLNGKVINIKNFIELSREEIDKSYENIIK